MSTRLLRRMQDRAVGSAVETKQESFETPFFFTSKDPEAREQLFAFLNVICRQDSSTVKIDRFLVQDVRVMRCLVDLAQDETAGRMSVFATYMLQLLSYESNTFCMNLAQSEFMGVCWARLQKQAASGFEEDLPLLLLCIGNVSALLEIPIDYTVLHNVVDKLATADVDPGVHDQIVRLLWQRSFIDPAEVYEFEAYYLAQDTARNQRRTEEILMNCLCCGFSLRLFKFVAERPSFQSIFQDKIPPEDAGVLLSELSDTEFLQVCKKAHNSDFCLNLLCAAPQEMVDRMLEANAVTILYTRAAQTHDPRVEQFAKRWMPFYPDCAQFELFPRVFPNLLNQ